MLFSKRRHIVVVSPLLFILCFSLYTSGLKNGFLIDDNNFLSKRYIYDFRSFHDFFTITKSQHYNPFHFLFNMYLFHVFGDNPIGMRVINVVLFYFNCVFIYFFIMLSTKNHKLALLTSILFCVHPINSVVVNPITFNTVLIFGIFVLLSLITFWFFIEQKRGGRYFYILSMIFYIFSLLCIENALVLPFYLVGLMYFFKKTNLQRSFKKCVPFFIISVCYIILWFFIVGHVSFLTHNRLMNISVGSYVASYVKLVGWYISMLFMPFKVVWIYNISPVNNNFWTWVILLLCFLSVFFVFKRYKKSFVSFYLVWFLVGLFSIIPAILAHNYMGFVIEPYWLYFSSIGFFLLLSYFLLKLSRKLDKKLRVGLFVSVIIFFVFYTQYYNAIAKTEESFCKFWIKVCPRNPIPLYRLAVINAGEKKYALAIAYNQEILRLGNYQEPLVYYNMGEIFMQMGEMNKAKEFVFKALRENPHFAAAYNLLGTIAVCEKKYQQAEEYFIEAVDNNVFFTMAVLNLTDLYIITHQWQKASSFLEKLPLNDFLRPDRQPILARLAGVYLKEKKIKKSFRIVSQIIEDGQINSFLLVASVFNGMGLSQPALHILGVCLKLHPREGKCLSMILAIENGIQS